MGRKVGFSTMNEIDVNLERFANFMADMIEKYGAEIDLEQLNNEQNAQAEIFEISASSFLRGINYLISNFSVHFLEILRDILVKRVGRTEKES